MSLDGTNQHALPVSQHSSMPSSASLHGRGIGAMFMAFFGSVWLAMASWVARPEEYLPLGVIALLGGGLGMLGWRAVQRYRALRTGEVTPAYAADKAKQFGIINGTQWVAIVVLIAALNLFGQPQWITPGIMLIVGAHFFPLAVLFHYRPHLIVGSVLSVLAVTYPFLTPAGPLSPVGPVCAGLILWAGALALLGDIARHDRH